MNKKLVVLVTFILVSITFASAEIFLSKQPQQLYTLGDKLEIDLGTDGEEGWADVSLVCSNTSKLLFFNFLNKDYKTQSFSFPLTKEFLHGMSGNCNVALKFNTKEKQSLQFIIDDSISVDSTFNSLSFSPNSTIEFSGTTSKKNGKKVNGFAEISIENTQLEIISNVKDDKFAGEINLPENIPSGKYSLNIFVYEKEGEEITNNGFQNFTISILQQPKRLILESVDEINPKEDIKFKSLLYDQADMTIDGKQVSFNLNDSNGEELINILSNTGDTNSYKVRSNTPVGYMTLKAFSEGIEITKQIFVKENQEVSFDLINGTLVVKNIGNVLYTKFIEISIGNLTKVENMSLPTGISKEFFLEAPEGEYNVKVRDDSQELSMNTRLTGKAISIRDRNSKFSDSFLNKGIFAWVILVLILGLFIFVSVRKYYKKEKFSVSNDKQKTNIYGGGVVKVTPTSKGNFFDSNENSVASHSLVIDGEKQKSAIIALKIKNKFEIDKSGSNANEAVLQATRIISENRAKIYKSEGYIVGILAPVSTKTFHNSLNALKIGDKISAVLNEHNRKYTQKISFGIGINSGDIIAKNELGKLSFTALGNCLTDAKRIAETADNSLLIGENASRDIGSAAKFVLNPSKLGIKTYSVKEIIDRSNNSKFIDSFLERNSEHKKLDNFRFDK